MDDKEGSGYHGNLLGRLLPPLSLNWIPLVLKVYRGVRKLLSQEAHEGIYEVLEYDSVLELLDRRGETALFKKHERVKFLQDNIIAYQDHAWGAGEVLDDYHCSPGIEVDRYQEGDRWNVLISLRETRCSGDVEDFYIERKLRHSFKKSEEWWQIETYRQTRWLKFSLIFPRERRCQRAVILEKTRNQTIVLDSGHFSKLPDGRQVLTWETKKPRHFETYTIKWTW